MSASGRTRLKFGRLSAWSFEANTLGMSRECNFRSFGKLASLSREASDKSVHSRRDDESQAYSRTSGLLTETAAQAIKASLTAGTWLGVGHVSLA